MDGKCIESTTITETMERILKKVTSVDSLSIQVKDRLFGPAPEACDEAKKDQPGSIERTTRDIERVIDSVGSCLDQILIRL